MFTNCLVYGCVVVASFVVVGGCLLSLMVVYSVRLDLLLLVVAFVVVYVLCFVISFAFCLYCVFAGVCFVLYLRLIRCCLIVVVCFWLGGCCLCFVFC